MTDNEKQEIQNYIDQAINGAIKELKKQLP